MRCFFFFSSRRRHTRWTGDWSSDVCSSDLHSALITRRTGVSREGLITALRTKVIYDCGAYGGFTPSPMLHGAVHAAGAYRVPNMEIEALRVYTNTVPRGYMRAPGAAQVIFSAESDFDMIAHEM